VKGSTFCSLHRSKRLETNIKEIFWRLYSGVLVVCIKYFLVTYKMRFFTFDFYYYVGSFQVFLYLRDIFWIFSFYVRYSTLLHLSPLKFHCVGGCWDRTQYWIANSALTLYITTVLDFIWKLCIFDFQFEELCTILCCYSWRRINSWFQPV